jgi:hypothetical protein
MKKMVSLITIALGLMIAGAPTFAEKPKEVVIVNGESSPVSVSGKVTLTGTATVALPKLIRMQFTGNCSTTGQPDCGKYVYDVPTGRRLVIEYFSCTAQVDTGQSLVCALYTGSIKSNGILQLPHFLPSTPPAGRFQSVSAGQQVMVFSDPGTTIGFSATVNGSQSLYVNYSLSGYLEDVP